MRKQPRGTFVVYGRNAKRVPTRYFRSIECARRAALVVAARDPGGACIDKMGGHGLTPLLSVFGNGVERRDW